MKKFSIKKYLLPLAFFAVFLALGLNSTLKTMTYTVESEKISSKIRLALVTDLHSCRYGKNEETLLKAIYKANPDAILIAGDFFDDKISSKNCESFLEGVCGKYPVYYVTGNHEYWASEKDFTDDMELLSKYKVARLSGEALRLNINGAQITLCGIDDPFNYLKNEKENFYTQLENVSKEISPDTFSILLTHRPEFFKTYKNRAFDLITAGHAHGGQWRIPFVLNGLYAPDQGLFPKYAGGLYNDGSTTMIVSRGLARESTRVPRFFNRPELVIIELTGSAGM